MPTQLLGNMMFLGVASVARPASKERFPVAVGMANIGSKGRVHTELIIPSEQWDLLKLETEQEKEERKKDKKQKRQQILAHFSEDEILRKGNSPEKTAAIMLKKIEGQTVFSTNPQHDLQMLNKLSPSMAGKICKR